MPRDAITVQQVTAAGLTPAAAVTGVAANDLSFVATSRLIFIEVNNGHATLARTVTIVTSATPGGLALADIDVSVPALGRKLIWPFESLGLTEYFAQDVDGTVHINIVDDTDLTFRVFKLA